MILFCISKAHIMVKRKESQRKVVDRDDKNICVYRYSHIKSVTDSWYLWVLICYSRVVDILIPINKRVGCGYHTICIREYMLPSKN